MSNASYAQGDTQRYARAKANDVADTASDLANKAGDQVNKMKDSAEHAMKSVAEQAGDAQERVSAVAGNIKTAIEKSVDEQPMATLAVAAALGFVIGALWKS